MVAKQVRAAYTQEFRLEAVRLVQSGQSQMQVCQMLGIPKASLGSWVRQLKAGTLKLGVADGAVSKVTPEQIVVVKFPDGQVKFPHPWPPQIPPGRTAGL